MENKFAIKKVTKKNFLPWLEMGILLWPKDSKKELEKEFQKILASKRETAFIAENTQGEYLGFANVSKRFEAVAGATSYPVGYIEGIFVKEKYRKMGVAKKLFESAQNWAKKNDCQEIGSDTWKWNKASQKFHQKLGFKQDNILVHFIKNI